MEITTHTELLSMSSSRTIPITPSKAPSKQVRGDYAGRIADELKYNRREIERIYSNDFVASGDRVRMKLALVSPKLYSYVTKGYEKLIIPLRNRG